MSQIRASHAPSQLRRLLALGPLPPGLAEQLAMHYSVVPLWEQPDRAAYLRAEAGRFDGAVTMSRHGGAADVMACVAGRVLACFGVGFEQIDMAAAKAHNVQVSTTPDVPTECVADTAFALMLATARRVVAADRFVQGGAWAKGGFPLSRSVHHKRLGIVGLGRIGRAVARRAAGFEMTVRYHGRHVQSDVSYAFEPHLLELARWADFLVIATQGGPETRHLINAAVLDALGPAGTLVNIARGSVVDETALVAALQSGRLGGAGLDVYEREPHPDAGLLARDDVVLLPHVAALTYETRAAMEQAVVDNLAAFFATGHVLTPAA